MSKRIGIPKALLYYRHFDKWKNFLERLGFEVIVSASTNEAILKDGLRQSVVDLCLPVKAVLGHVTSLKDCVDYIFIPRYISVEKDAYMCPKFIGLPDVVRASISKLPPVVDPILNAKEEGAVDIFSSGISKALAVNKKAAAAAWAEAEIEATKGFKTQLKGLEAHHKGLKAPSGLRIAVIGRAYLIFDGYLSKNIVKGIEGFGAEVITGEPSAEDIETAMGMLTKWIYWSMSREIVASGYKHFRDPSIDGVINLSNATCGPDSFTGEIINRLHRELEARHSGLEAPKGGSKPYMCISIDEHTSAVGMQTRIEAFLDMIKFCHEKNA